MEALVRLGFRRIRIEDDLFTFRRERALAICKEIDRRGLTIRWRAYSRVDTIDAELLQWMKRTGCERLLYGAESGSPEILKKIRKGITPEQTRRAVEMTREAGIGVLASFVLGLPGETPQTLQQTLEFAESLRVPYTPEPPHPLCGNGGSGESRRVGDPGPFRRLASLRARRSPNLHSNRNPVASEPGCGQLQKGPAKVPGRPPGEGTARDFNGEEFESAGTEPPLGLFATADRGRDSGALWKCPSGIGQERCERTGQISRPSSGNDHRRG